MVTPTCQLAEALLFEGETHGGHWPRGPRELLRQSRRQKPQGGRRDSKEFGQPFGSLTLCRAGRTTSGQPFGGMPKPMRGGCVEARSQGRRGKTSERQV